EAGVFLERSPGTARFGILAEESQHILHILAMDSRHLHVPNPEPVAAVGVNGVFKGGRCGFSRPVALGRRPAEDALDKVNDRVPVDGGVRPMFRRPFGYWPTPRRAPAFGGQPSCRQRISGYEPTYHPFCDRSQGSLARSPSIGLRASSAY